MSALKKNYYIKSRDFIRAGEASIKIQTLLKSLDFNPQLVRRVAICGYEGEMNVVMHGGDGQLSVEIDASTLVMEISDNGPGIEDIEKATIGTITKAIFPRAKPETKRYMMDRHIKNLEELNLVKKIKQGREKIIELTESGARVIEEQLNKKNSSVPLT